MNEKQVQATGGCLCEAVRYEIRGPHRGVVNCHCEQCRRTSGHFVAATRASKDDFIFVEDRGLRWFVSSSFARRGFCQFCGSSLFWERTDDEENRISIMAGTLDQPSGLSTVENIFVEDAGDYYNIPEIDAAHIE